MPLPSSRAEDGARLTTRARSLMYRVLSTGIALLVLGACQDNQLSTGPESGAIPGTPRTVINGSEVSAGDWASTWSFAVALVQPKAEGGYASFCTGSVIAQRWILTAAHCLKHTPLANVFIAVGDRDLLGSNIRYLPAKSVHISAYYDENSLIGDVALVELFVDAAVTPVTLAEDYVYDGMALRTAGFGLTEDGTAATLLRTTRMVVDDALYSTWHFSVGGTNTGMCSGDSGGPALSASGEIMGVLSFGSFPCDDLFFAGYTDGYSALLWANTIVGTALDRRAPNVSEVSTNPDLLVSVRSPVTVTARATENGSFESGIAAMEASFDGVVWVPMQASDGAFDSADESAAVQLSASAAGIRSLCVRARDVSGKTSTPSCRVLSVFDPSAGFVVGNGTFRAPAGSFPWDLSHQDDVEFRFMSAYRKGASVPTGQTSFVFKTTAMVLESSSYDVLVVTGSDKAQFRGSGRVTFTSPDAPVGYELWVKFEVWVSSSDQTIRARIWEPDYYGDREYFNTTSFVPVKTGRVIVQTPPK